MKRKLFSLLLVLAMLLSMSSGALAAHVTPEISAPEIEAGQTVDVILKINEEVSDIVALQYDVYFDATLFDYTSSVRGESNAKTTISTQKTDAATGETYYSVLYVDNSAEGDPQTFTVGTLYTLTFTAKEDVTATTQASFRVLEKALDTSDFESLRDTNYEGILDVTVKAGEEPPAPQGYTVAISEDQTKTVGDPATVSVTVGSSEYDSFNTVDMSFSYDADKLELTTAEIEGYILKTGDGTIRVQRFGADCPVGAAFALEFKCIAAGEAKVRLTDAKVDNSSGAASGDMPAATITADTVTITVNSQAHTHTYGAPVWTWTETADGYSAKATFTCTSGDDTQVVNAAVTAVTTEPTCTAAGKTVYTAKAVFRNREYTDTKEAVIEATGHSYGAPVWTWTETADGYSAKATFTCTSGDDTQVVNAAVTAVTTAPTCTAAGKTVYTAKAVFQNREYTDTKEVVIEATGHSYGAPVWTWTETDGGYSAKATFTCAAGDDTQELEAAVTAETIPPTATEDGRTVYTAKVVFRNTEYTDTKEVAGEPATGHSYGAPVWTWTETADGYSAKATFTSTDGEDTQEVEATVTAETIAPTCTEDGRTVYTAKVVFLNREYTDTKEAAGEPATGHSYGAPVWTWTETDGGYSAKASFTCAAGDDTQEIEATVTAETTAPTCTEDGRTVYTAKAVFRNTEYTDTKEVVIEATGHDWDEGEITTEPTCTEPGVKTYTCLHDKSHTRTEEIPALGHDWGPWTVTVEATETEPGLRTRTCRRCGETQTEVIPATGSDEPEPERNAIVIRESENGSVTAQPEKAAARVSVMLTVKPDEGYELAEISAVDAYGNEISLTKNADGTYSFRMPDSTVTVRAVFRAKENAADRFTDVTEDDWFYEAVDWAAGNGLMRGMGETLFCPYAPMTRGMVAVIIHRMEGEPAAGTKNPFTDVADGQWYTAAVDWAAENGIILGYPDGTYAPLQDITREELSAILMRYAAYKGRDVSARADLGRLFTDAEDVSGWAKENVSWAVAAGLLKGRDGDRLAPLAKATRAEGAMLFMRFDAYLK